MFRSRLWLSSITAQWSGRPHVFLCQEENAPKQSIPAVFKFNLHENLIISVTKERHSARWPQTAILSPLIHFRNRKLCMIVNYAYPEVWHSATGGGLCLVSLACCCDILYYTDRERGTLECKLSDQPPISLSQGTGRAGKYSTVWTGLWGFKLKTK